MKRTAAVLALLLLFPIFSTAIAEFNCNSICAGAFCQDKFNNPAPRSGETAIKYTTDSAVLLNRFGNGVFCGAFETSRCIVPNSCLQVGGGGGGTPPACTSVFLHLPPTYAANTQEPTLTTDFWGYNYSQDWLNQCDPQAPPGQRCGMVPSLFVSARCRDAGGNEIACPATPTFSATVGTIETDPVSNQPGNKLWRSVNYPTPVTITASVTGCTNPTGVASFQLHILDACSLSPSSAVLDMGKNQTFSGTCYDETLQPRACYYPLIMHALPDALGNVFQNTQPTGVPLGNTPPVGDRGARIWMDSTVNFTAGYLDAIGQLSGAGPTFVCAAPITVGNPATACTLSLSSNTVAVGQTIQATPSCTGPKGPASCPDFDFWAAPSAIRSWANASQANITGTIPGVATVHAASSLRQTCVLDQTITFFDLVTPEITTCAFVPHDATASLSLPADASNIRAALASGGTDDGCTKIDVNGQRVFDEGCDAGYRYASCGLHVKAHDLAIPTALPIPLKAGANTLRGQNVDSYGAFSALRIRITGTYQASQCSGPSIPTTPISCQADLTVTPGACTTPPRASSFSPEESTRFDQQQPGDLAHVRNLVLARPEFRIQYASDVFACAQDFDGGIRSGIGFLAVDATRFHATVARPAGGVTITFRNLPYAQMPRLFMLDEFADSPASVLQRGQDCTLDGKCSNLRFDAASRTLTFQAAGFSSYASQDSTIATPSPSISPTPCAGPVCPTPSTSPESTPAPNPPEIRFILDCPLPQIGQNKTRATAFLYVNGTPFTDANMTLEFSLNDTYAFETTPVLINPATGQHEFTVDTRYGGTYQLRAYADNYTSNECRLDVFEEDSTPIPELNEWLILLLFAAAGWLAYGKRR